jgi:hypothetical protein
MTQTELAGELDLTKVAVGGLLERMEVVGLVRRDPDDTDARIRRIYLTRLGARLMDRAHKHIELIVKQILGPNSRQEISTLTRVLMRMKVTLLQMIDKENQEQERSTARVAQRAKRVRHTLRSATRAQPKPPMSSSPRRLAKHQRPSSRTNSSM